MANDSIPRRIRLTQGKSALVDAADFELLSSLRWRALKVRRTWYAVTVSGGKHEMYMHNFIMQSGPGEQVDHRNGDALDNRRLNLRNTTHARNQMNRRTVRSKSGFKGVCWSPLPNGKPRPWRAYITVKGRQRHLGRFETAEEAARAYDTVARELFGEDACTNLDLGLLPR